jgi:O-antigen/teichoic acid export membrane protein
MSYAHRITKATFTILAFSLATALLGYFLKIYLARNLSTESFGLFYAVLSLTALLFLLKDMGLGPALAKYLPEFYHKKDFKNLKSAILFSYFFQFLAGILIAIIFYLNSDYISANFFHNAGATPVLIVMLAELVIASSTVKFVLQGLQFIKSYAAVELLRIIFVLFFVLFFISNGTVGVAMSYLFASLSMQIIFSIYIISKTRKMKAENCTDRKIFKMIVKFGSYFFFGGVAGFLIAYTDTLVLTALRTLNEVGLYQVAISTSQVLWGIALALSVVLMPVISEMWIKNEKEKVSKGISFLLKYTMVILIPAMILMVAFSEIVINLLFGFRYLEASSSLQILAFGAVFYSLMTIYATTLASIGRPDISTKITILVGVFNLFANIILIQIIGIIGAAVATTTAYFIGFCVYHKYFRHLINVNIHKLDIIKIIIGTFLSLFIIYISKEMLVIDVFIESIITVIIAILFYMLFILRIRIIEKDDISILRASKLPLPKWFLRLLERNSR